MIFKVANKNIISGSREHICVYTHTISAILRISCFAVISCLTSIFFNIRRLPQMMRQIALLLQKEIGHPNFIRILLDDFFSLVYQSGLPKKSRELWQIYWFSFNVTSCGTHSSSSSSFNIVMYLKHTLITPVCTWISIEWASVSIFIQNIITSSLIYVLVHLCCFILHI